MAFYSKLTKHEVSKLIILKVCDFIISEHCNDTEDSINAEFAADVLYQNHSALSEFIVPERVASSSISAYVPGGTREQHNVLNLFLTQHELT